MKSLSLRLASLDSSLLANAFMVAALSVCSAHAQADGAMPVTSTATVAISGEDGKINKIDFAALDQLPQQSVHAQAHGNTVDCLGPNLIDVLTKSGAPSGEALRGKALALYVRVSAADGYRVVFSLAEIDPGLRDSVPILTHLCSGKPLDSKEGPFRIIGPGEKRPARWIRQVTSIDILRSP
jgi:hypothetical protein